jgi:hypothetical protein
MPAPAAAPSYTTLAALWFILYWEISCSKSGNIYRPVFLQLLQANIKVSVSTCNLYAVLQNYIVTYCIFSHYYTIANAKYFFMCLAVSLDNKALYYIVLLRVALSPCFAVNYSWRFMSFPLFLLPTFGCAVRTYVRAMCRIIVVAFLYSVWLLYLYALVMWSVACEQHSWLQLQKNVYTY